MRRPLQVGDVVKIDAKVIGAYWPVETHMGRLIVVAVDSAMPGSAPVQFMVPESGLRRPRKS